MVSTRTSREEMRVERTPARHWPRKGLRKVRPGWARASNRPHLSTMPTLAWSIQAQNKQNVFTISSPRRRPPFCALPIHHNFHTNSQPNCLIELNFDPLLFFFSPSRSRMDAFDSGRMLLFQRFFPSKNRFHFRR